ncbi:MAG: tRNA dihydrouridine synthase DusB [Pseudomonadota bacterium]
MLAIGPHRLSSRVVLAPMAGVTDLPLRALAWEFGAGAVVSEMVTDRPDLWHSRKSRLRRQSSTAVRPHIVQIAGHDPNMLAEAALRLEAHGAQVVDINFGCPMKKVCRKLAGSALLADPDRVVALTKAVCRAVSVPVTVKMRTGPDLAQRTAPELAPRLEDVGVAALTVHGRTRACRFNGAAEFDTIAEIKRRISIPVIANGDIRTLADARRVLTQCDADGLMIGRGALGAPWVPGDLGRALAQGGSLPLRSDEHRLAVARDHLGRLHEFYGDAQGLKIARKHVGWYLDGLKAAADERSAALGRWRRSFNAVDSSVEQLDRLDGLRSALVDRTLSIDAAA